MRCWRQRRKTLQTEVEQLRHRRTVGAKEIAILIKNNQDAEHLKKQMQEVQQRIKLKTEILNEVLAALLDLQLQLPNLTDDSVPEGKDETSNRTELQFTATYRSFHLSQNNITRSCRIGKIWLWQAAWPAVVLHFFQANWRFCTGHSSK